MDNAAAAFPGFARLLTFPSFHLKTPLGFSSRLPKSTSPLPWHLLSPTFLGHKPLLGTCPSAAGAALPQGLQREQLCRLPWAFAVIRLLGEPGLPRSQLLQGWFLFVLPRLFFLIVLHGRRVN